MEECGIQDKENRKRAIERHLAKIEKKIEDAVSESDAKILFELETRMHILKVYLNALNCSVKDPTYLDRKNIELDVNESILASLSLDARTIIICLTKG